MTSRRRRTFGAVLPAATCTWLLAVAASASAHPPIASFEYEPELPAPGELVEFRSTSTGPPEHTEPMLLDWDLDGDGQFDDANGAAVRRAFDQGVHVVRLRARYLSAAGSHEDVTEQSIAVGEPIPSLRRSRRRTPRPTTPEPMPAPSGNQPPAAVFEKDCGKVGGFVVCAGLFAREGKPKTLDASPSSDPDGSIVRYEWDLDGTGGFERDTGATPTVTHTFEAYKGLVDPRKRPVRVRVTDDKGATSEAAMTLALLEPSCEPLVTRGRLSATGICLRPRNIEVGGKKVVRWYSERPVTVNGIRIVPATGRLVLIDLPAEAGAPAPRIASGGAAVGLPAVQGTTVDLLDGSFSWGLERRRPPVGLPARLRRPRERSRGLRARRRARVVERQPLVALRAARRAALAVRRRHVGPAGRADARQGGRGGERAAQLRGRQRVDRADRTGVAEGHVRRRGLVGDLHARQAPPPIPYTVGGEAGIRAGAFEYAGAEIDFGTPGIGPLGPVFLQRIAFRIEIAPKQSECVPKVGIEYVDQRKILHDITGNWYDVPNFEIDHGIPTFALCGEVGLTGGPDVLGVSAIRLDAGLGLATYADRPAVFRAFGKVYLVEIPLARPTWSCTPTATRA